MMHLVIVAPSGILCLSTIEKISLPGEVGAFTVLPGHASLISHLTAVEIVYTAEGKENRIKIKSGFAKIDKDHVEVCVETEDKK